MPDFCKCLNWGCFVAKITTSQWARIHYTSFFRTVSLPSDWPQPISLILGANNNDSTWHFCWGISMFFANHNCILVCTWEIIYCLLNYASKLETASALGSCCERKAGQEKRGHQTRARLLLLKFLSEFLLQPDPVQRPPIASSTPLPRTEPSVIPAARNEPIGLKVSDFLPVSVSGQKFPNSVCVGSHQTAVSLRCRRVS